MGCDIHGRTADQRPDQAANAPQQPNTGIRGHQILTLELLANQHQCQGIDTSGNGPQHYQGRPQQPLHLQQPGQGQADQHRHHATHQMHQGPFAAVSQPAQR
ncbi:hypothetical protein D3C76_1355350 [compost metagenome]